MCAKWKWNNVSQASHLESLVLPQWQYTGMRMFASILRLTFFFVWKMWEDFNLETLHKVASHFCLVKQNLLNVLFPAAMQSAVAVTNRPQSHSRHFAGLALTIWGGHCLHVVLLIHKPGTLAAPQSEVRRSEERLSYHSHGSWIEFVHSQTVNVKLKKVKLVYS